MVKEVFHLSANKGTEPDVLERDPVAVTFKTPVALVVCNKPNNINLDMLGSNDLQFVFSNIRNLNSELLARYRPSVVISSLFCPTFDCHEVALILQNLGYNGRYCIISDKIPRQTQIISELNRLCPYLDIDIVFKTA